MLLKFALKDFMQDREFKNMSKATLTSYKYTLNEFHDFCIKQEIDDATEITTSTVKEYLLFCQRDKGNNPTTINHKIINLRAFFNYLEKELELFTSKHNPTRKIQKLRHDIRIEVFTDYQVRQILNYFARLKYRDKTFFAIRDTAIVVTLLGTGMRLGELVNLKWSDINFGTDTIVVFGKKRMQSSIPMTAKLAKELAEYRLHCEKKFGQLPQYVFTNKDGHQSSADAIQHIFKRLAKIMNFKDVRLSCHTFRHYFAMKCLQGGMDVFTLKNLLRHSDLSMTERYLSLWGTALREINDKHNPLNNVDL